MSKADHFFKASEEKIEDLEGRKDCSISTLENHYEDVIGVVKEYVESENSMNYVSTKRILEKSDKDYSTKKFAQRMYPLAEIDVIGRWGGDSQNTQGI